MRFPPSSWPTTDCSIVRLVHMQRTAHPYWLKVVNGEFTAINGAGERHLGVRVLDHDSPHYIFNHFHDSMGWAADICYSVAFRLAWRRNERLLSTLHYPKSRYPSELLIWSWRNDVSTTCNLSILLTAHSSRISNLASYRGAISWRFRSLQVIIGERRKKCACESRQLSKF